MATIDLELPEELRAFVDAQAQAGGYGNAADYVRELLNLIWRQQTGRELENELVRRLDGPAPIEIPPQFWDDLKARLRRRNSQGANA